MSQKKTKDLKKKGGKKDLKAEVSKQLRQRYGATLTNMVICVDTTELGSFGNLFLAVDLAARCIIGHTFRTVAIDSEDVIECLEGSFDDRAFLPPVKIVHSDRGSLFNSAVFLKFLENRGITPSRGSSKAHQNQVIERLNRTIKERIKTKLDPTWRKSEGKPETNPLQKPPIQLNSTEFIALVKTVVEEYNNSPHATLHGMSPNQVEELLFERWYRNEGNTEVALHKTDSVEYQNFMGGVKDEFVNSIERDFVSAVKQEYAGDWQRFFIEWRAELTQRHRTATQHHHTVLAAMEKAHATLYEQFLEVQKELKVLRAEAAHARAERESKEARRHQKANRKKQPIKNRANEN